MNHGLVFIFILVLSYTTTKAQVGSGSMVLPVTIGYTHNDLNSLSLGLGYGKIDAVAYVFMGYGVLADVLIPTTQNQPWGARLGVEGFGGVTLIGSAVRLDVIYYQLDDVSEWHLSPSLGWSLGAINFMYTYSAPIKDSDAFAIQRHQFTTRVSIPIFHRRMKKWSN